MGRNKEPEHLKDVKNVVCAGGATSFLAVAAFEPKGAFCPATSSLLNYRLRMQRNHLGIRAEAILAAVPIEWGGFVFDEKAQIQFTNVADFFNIVLSKANPFFRRKGSNPGPGRVTLATHSPLDRHAVHRDVTAFVSAASITVSGAFLLLAPLADFVPAFGFLLLARLHRADTESKHQTQC